MGDIQSIDLSKQQVTLDDETILDHKRFMERFMAFWDKRIVGKTIVPLFYENLFGKGGSNAMELLMKGMKHEGYLLGSMDKLLTKKQALAVGVIVTFIIVGVMVLIILRNQGMIPV